MLAKYVIPGATPVATSPISRGIVLKEKQLIRQDIRKWGPAKFAGLSLVEDPEIKGADDGL